GETPPYPGNNQAHYGSLKRLFPWSDTFLKTNAQWRVFEISVRRNSLVTRGFIEPDRFRLAGAGFQPHFLVAKPLSHRFEFVEDLAADPPAASAGFDIHSFDLGRLLVETPEAATARWPTLDAG